MAGGTFFFYKETKIYEETDQEKKRILSVDDPRVWEYLKAIRIADTIVQNLIHCWARDALESCPRKIKNLRSKPEEEEKGVIIISDSDEHMPVEKYKKNNISTILPAFFLCCLCRSFILKLKRSHEFTSSLKFSGGFAPRPPDANPSCPSPAENFREEVNS